MTNLINEYKKLNAIRIEAIQCVDFPMGIMKGVGKQLAELEAQGIGECSVCNIIGQHSVLSDDYGATVLICSDSICLKRFNNKI